MRRNFQKQVRFRSKGSFMGIAKKGKPFFKVLRGIRIEKNTVEQCKYVGIPAKANWEPLEFTAKIGDVVIFAKTKYEPYTKILKALKLI